jgi:MFS family permease
MRTRGVIVEDRNRREKRPTTPEPAMTATPAMTPRAAWLLILSASAILMITMAARLTTGLFLSPINTSTGLGIASISFALAVGQFMWGASQPIFGAVADKYGAGARDRAGRRDAGRSAWRPRPSCPRNGA